jgi:hypothetical protein
MCVVQQTGSHQVVRAEMSLNVGPNIMHTILEPIGRIIISTRFEKIREEMKRKVTQDLFLLLSLSPTGAYSALQEKQLALS